MTEAERKVYVEATVDAIFTEGGKQAIGMCAKTLNPDQLREIPLMCAKFAELLHEKHLTEAHAVILFSAMLGDVVTEMVIGLQLDISKHDKN